MSGCLRGLFFWLGQLKTHLRHSFLENFTLSFCAFFGKNRGQALTPQPCMVASVHPFEGGLAIPSSSMYQIPVHLASGIETVFVVDHNSKNLYSLRVSINFIEAFGKFLQQSWVHLSVKDFLETNRHTPNVCEYAPDLCSETRAVRASILCNRSQGFYRY